MSKYTFEISTCINNTPRLFPELILWVICLRSWFNDSITVYFFDFSNELLENFLKSYNIKIVYLKSLFPKSPHSNRIQYFQEECNYDFKIITDCDVYIVENFLLFLENENQIFANANYAANPPEYIFKDIFKKLNLSHKYIPSIVPIANKKSRETHLNNINAGIIILNKEKRKYFANEWLKNALYLDNNINLLQDYKIHLDQVSFALTVETTNNKISFLPFQFSIILNLLDKIETVYGFHLSTGHIPSYGHLFYDDKTLKINLFKDSIAPQINKLNKFILLARSMITQELDSLFLNPNYLR